MTGAPVIPDEAKRRSGTQDNVDAEKGTARPSLVLSAWRSWVPGSRFARPGMTIAAWLAIALVSVPAAAVEPGEMLKDPALEARARTISEGLRCLVCQNESIDESHADLARDIRLLVRQRLLAGDSNDQVRDYLVDRYGQFILLKPPFELQTLMLWGTPIIVLVLGGIGLVFAMRRRPRDLTHRQLTEAEQKTVENLLAGQEKG